MPRTLVQHRCAAKPLMQPTDAARPLARRMDVAKTLVKHIDVAGITQRDRLSEADSPMPCPPRVPPLRITRAERD